MIEFCMYYVAPVMVGILFIGIIFGLEGLSDDSTK